MYLTSRRFLDWATPDRLSGGLARRGSDASEVAETRRQIQLEYEDVAAWLRLKGVCDLGADPSAILAETHSDRLIPAFGSVSQSKTSGIRACSNPPAELTSRSTSSNDCGPEHPQRPRPEQATIEKRPAVAIIRHGPAGEHPSLIPHLEGNFRRSAPTFNDLTKLLPPHTDPRIRRLLAETAQHGLLDIDASAKTRQTARAVVGPRKEDISEGDGSHRLVLDLRRSDLGEV